MHYFQDVKDASDQTWPTLFLKALSLHYHIQTITTIFKASMSLSIDTTSIPTNAETITMIATVAFNECCC